MISDGVYCISGAPWQGSTSAPVWQQVLRRATQHSHHSWVIDFILADWFCGDDVMGVSYIADLSQLQVSAYAETRGQCASLAAHMTFVGLRLRKPTLSLSLSRYWFKRTSLFVVALQSPWCAGPNTVQVEPPEEASATTVPAGVPRVASQSHFHLQQLSKIWVTCDQPVILWSYILRGREDATLR